MGRGEEGRLAGIAPAVAQQHAGDTSAAVRGEVGHRVPPACLRPAGYRMLKPNTQHHMRHRWRLPKCLGRPSRLPARVGPLPHLRSAQQRWLLDTKCSVVSA